MGRVKSSVRKRGGHTEESMRRALELIKSGMSIRKASEQCQLKYPTVRLYVQRNKENSSGEVRLTPNYEVNKIFNSEEEKEILRYIDYCAQLFYGLTSKDCRRLAYQMAKVNNKNIPQSWTNNEMAGVEWLRSFKNRHSEISLKKPEACSLARASAFNQHNIKKFFDNLRTAMNRHPSFADGTRVYNLDETSTTTVQRPSKVLARKGTNVSKVTSGERGTLVTTCCIVSAAGHALPPAMVFPRKKFQPHMLHGAPPGTLGLAAASGWMNADIFVDVIKHFIKTVSATKDNPALLIMDNHESHLSIDALNLAKDSGVTILTLHPHTTSKLQPLDVGLNGPFKTYYNAAMDSWLLRNPGQPITIYNIAECVGTAYMKAMTPVNITNAFKKCGIFPFDDCIFTETDFMPSTVTDRPENIVEIEEIEDPRILEDGASSPSIFMHNHDELQPLFPDIEPTNITPNISPSIERPRLLLSNCQNTDFQPSPSTSRKFVSPMQFMPPIKAKPRNPKRRRAPGRSMIATDTPEKLSIEEKKNKRDINRIKNTKQDIFDKKKEKQKCLDTSDEEEDEFLASGSSSGGAEYYNISEDEEVDGKVVLDGNFSQLQRDPIVGEYVVVLFPFKKTFVYYVGKILEIIDDNDDDADFFVSFLRIKNRSRQTFCEPIMIDTAGIQIKDIKYILPAPKITGSSRRQASLSFDVYFDISSFNLR